MPPKLEDFLSAEEALEVRRMAEHSQGWTYWLKLLRSVEELALREAVEFQDPNKAFEKKGFAKGIMLIKDLAHNLYNVRVTGAEASKDGNASSTAAGSAWNTAGAPEPEPEPKPTGWSY